MDRLANYCQAVISRNPRASGTEPPLPRVPYGASGNALHAVNMKVPPSFVNYSFSEPAEGGGGAPGGGAGAGIGRPRRGRMAGGTPVCGRAACGPDGGGNGGNGAPAAGRIPSPACYGHAGAGSVALQAVAARAICPPKGKDSRCSEFPGHAEAHDPITARPAHRGRGGAGGGHVGGGTVRTPIPGTTISRASSVGAPRGSTGRVTGYRLAEGRIPAVEHDRRTRDLPRRVSACRPLAGEALPQCCLRLPRRRRDARPGDGRAALRILRCDQAAVPHPRVALQGRLPAGVPVTEPRLAPGKTRRARWPGCAQAGGQESPRPPCHRR